jgi:phage recombination protein Bet
MTGTSLINRMADRRHLDPQTFYETVKTTLMPANTTKEQLAAFLMVADRYGLDPLTKEIYAFPNRKGTGITPVLSIDGWINLVNSHPQCDGFSVDYQKDDAGRLVSATCTMHRRDRSHPVVVTEYYSENYRNTEPWNQMPSRMLRHKAFKECARLAFGFAGITDEDEARDMGERPVVALERVEDNVVDALDAFAAGSETVVDDDLSGNANDGSSETSPKPVAAAAPARAEAIDKMLALATDKDMSVEQKLETLDLRKPDWMAEFLDAPNGPGFVTALFDTCAKVARGELKVPAARKYLEAMP